MRKYLLTCLVLLFAAAAIAQQKSTIHLVQSTRGVRITMNGADVFKVYNGVFQQQYSTLKSDSAYVYLANNTFDAFGHVVITQGDTLNIYANKLNYNDNTKIAILTDNVKMVDKDATLTTNYLTYNTATRFGTYTGGGKLVNKDNVLVSKNGYYFAQSRDAYFRYDVVLTTPDALIKTDTLRYNSGSRIAYFYGPTHIYGKKDKDTLYTENGTYNTKTEQAFFGKKNWYKQGTKSLKGDSLFYDRLKGYGKAVKRVTFDDTEQKITIKGNLGEYYKKDDKAVITQNPYVIFVTEDKKDSTKTDSVAKPIELPQKGKAVQPAVKNTIPIAKDAAITPSALTPQGASAKADSLAKIIAALPAVKNTVPVNKIADTIKKAGTVKNNAASKTTPPKPNKKTTTPAKSIKQSEKPNTKTPADSTGKADTAKVKSIPSPIDTSHVKRDSMYIGADTLETQIITYKALKDLQEQRRLAGIVDTTKKKRIPFVPYKTIPKELSLDPPRMISDPPTYLNRPLFTVVKPPADTTAKKGLTDSLKNKLPADPAKDKSKTDSLAKKGPPDNLKNKLPADAKAKNLPADNSKGKLPANATLKNKGKADTTAKATKPLLSDTSRVRILSAHHNVHIFKSDLQGKSDSLFYSSSDSIIRSFVKPMYWTQGSQLSGDTIYMQLKNKKLDNMDVFLSAFIVNIEDKDSTHFNQAGGKRLKGYFKDSKLSLADIEGNAETIYFNREKGKVTQMQRSLSSGIIINFKKGEITKISFLIKPDNKYFPIAKVKDDDKILKGFIWKPKDRPVSKEDVINPKKPVPEKTTAKKDTTGGKTPAGKTIMGKDGTKKAATGKNSLKKGGTGKPPVKAAALAPGVKDPVKAVPPAISPSGQLKRDSIIKTDTAKKAPGLILKKDTVKH